MGQHDRAPDTSPDKPTPDPLIDEVRQVRRELPECFDNDIRRLAEHLQEIQRRSTVPIRHAPTGEHRDAG